VFFPLLFNIVIDARLRRVAEGQESGATKIMVSLHMVTNTHSLSTGVLSRSAIIHGLGDITLMSCHVLCFMNGGNCGTSSQI
jgi:hypothetical protein